MTHADLTDLDVAHLLADAARNAILPHFRQSGLRAENKEAEGFDPVTVADRAAEQAIKERQEQETAERRKTGKRAKILEALELEGTL